MSKNKFVEEELILWIEVRTRLHGTFEMPDTYLRTV